MASLTLGISFTPEYSTELLGCIQGIYEEDIKHHYTHLKLEKSIDLLEHTEYLFESYLKFLQEGKNQDALTAFIVGCYYLYLIVPQSIQFQTRNKSYGIYNELKKIYENQMNMTNVLLMVKDEVDSVLDKDARDLKEIERSVSRKRAYSVPDQTMQAQLASLSLSNKIRLPPPLPNENQLRGVQSDNETLTEENDDSSPVWKAPSLEPNDQLKLVLDGTLLPPSAIPVDDQQLSHNLSSVSHSVRTRRGTHGSVPLRPSVFPNDEGQLDREGADNYFNEAAANKNFWEANVDRLTTHRKDSYHSVYMFDGDPEDESSSLSSSDGVIQGLERLQKQSIITAAELFTILSSHEERDKLLLIDLRLSKRSKVNHIVSPNTVEIDPRKLWNSQTKTPISNCSILDNLVANPVFTRRASFEYIVYYTDMKTYMRTEYDYMFTLFYLLTTSPVMNLKSLPTHLLGGYEKWKKVLHTYAAEYDIKIDDYLYRPYAETTPHGHGTPDKKSPEPPSWKPPAVPVRMRKRPPPPPPATMSLQAEIPPPLPPKHRIEPANKQYTKPGAPFHTERSPIHSKILKKSLRSSPQSQSPTRELYLKQQRYQSIPTIEKSSNTYVALSITGLRNLGNTCYINSMLQCLFATRLFRDLFISAKYESFFNEKFKTGLRLSKSFSLLFKKMYINGGCSVVPTGFLKVCNYLRPDLKIPDDQQDTQEFLMLILDRLHDELSNQTEVVSEYPSLLLYDEEELQVKNEEYKKWFEETVIGNGLSPIDHIFQGQMENSLECQRCGNSSLNYSTFYVLSLAIPKPSSSAFSRSKRVRLEDCINMFTSDEVLSGENAWDCPKCGSAVSGFGPVDPKKAKKKKHLEHTEEHRSKSRFFLLHSRTSRSKSPFRRLGPGKPPMENWKSNKLFTVKTLNFITLPPVLVIHLSRFYYDLTKKNNTIITYPLILNIILKNNETVKYRLYGVVNHSGNLISGHYTSLVNKELNHSLHKSKQKWYYFDDEVVKEETNHGNFDQGITKVSSSDVYVLFYERIDE